MRASVPVNVRFPRPRMYAAGSGCGRSAYEYGASCNRFGKLRLINGSIWGGRINRNRILFRVLVRLPDLHIQPPELDGA